MRFALCFLLILFASGTPAAEVSSGSGTLYGKSWSARGGFAYRDEGYTMVVLSSAALDPAKMVRDHRIDTMALIDHHTENKATVVKLMIDPKGQMTCFNVMAEPDSGNRCGDFKEALKLTRQDYERVVGALDWSGEGESLKLSFDLPITGSVDGK